MAFSPEGARLLTGSLDKTARLWDARTGQLLATLRGHQREVRSVAFSPEGTRLLTGSADETARLWDARTGKSLAILRGHRGWVSSVAFSPDGHLALVALGNGQVWFWDGHGHWAAPSLAYLYPVVFPIKAACWLGPRQVLLADNGGPEHRPFVYRLALEGY